MLRVTMVGGALGPKHADGDSIQIGANGSLSIIANGESRLVGNILRYIVTTVEEVQGQEIEEQTLPLPFP